MNAVDLAEQLMAIGRQVEQVEQQLRQPVVALESFTRLGELLVDPAVRLSALIAPHIHPPPAPRPPASRRLPASERFDFQPIPLHNASGSTILQPDGGAKAESRSKPQSAAEMDRDLDPRSPLDFAGPLGSRHAPPETPVGGVRLTRDRSSLLSLLQSNIQATGAQPASPGSAGQPALPAVTPELGDGAGNRPVAVAGKPPVDWGVPWTTGNSSLAQTMAVDETSSRVGMPSGEAERQLFGDSPAPIRHNGLPPNEGVAGSNPRWDGMDGPHAATAPLVPSVSGDTRHTGAPLPDFAAEHSGFDVRPDVIPAALQDVMIWDDPLRATAPLSAMQIDQLLDALDDRLELLLLRSYGTAP